MQAKERNSHAGRDDPLEWPHHTGTGKPYDADSISINCLLFAGNETLPNGVQNTWNGVQNTWSSAKSKAALLYYNIEGSESEPDDNEYSKTPRRRLRVARVLGISRAQLNFAQLAL